MSELSPFFMACLVLTAGHFVGDFAFQSEWMVLNKEKSWEVLFYHVCTYTAAMVIVGLMAPAGLVTFTAAGVLTIFVSHFLIDTFVKGRRGITKRIWIDQLCHVGVLVSLVVIGWL